MKMIALGSLVFLIGLGTSAVIAEAQTGDSTPPGPGATTVVNGANLGEVGLSWPAIAGATYYRIGWIAEADFLSAGDDWLERFAFVDIAGKTAYTITRLSPGEPYWFIVGSAEQRFGQAEWSTWVSLALNDDGQSCPTATEPMPVPTVQPTLGPTPGATSQSTNVGDYDSDDDGLIEVSNPAQLNAMRWDLDGDGSTTATGYTAAFPGALTGMGCPSSCNGYELTADLDLSTRFGDGLGWVPIGDRNFRWNATFDGDGHTISGLHIDRSDSENIGLFGISDDKSVIRNIGLDSVNVHGSEVIGGLIGSNHGTVIASYVTGNISGSSATSLVGGEVGGLAGENHGTIAASFSTAIVSSTGSWVGGLVGINAETIIASYSTGSVSGMGAVGGLVGLTYGSIQGSYATGYVSATRDSVGGLFGGRREDNTTASYWDTQTTGIPNLSGDAGKTTQELQAPTGYTGIYANWNVDVDGDSVADDPWDFGSSSQYPILKYGGLHVASQR